MGDLTENKLLLRNIRFYYTYMAAFQLLVGPILTLYLLHKGLSFTEIMALQSVYSFAVFLLEVPTGAVSDLLGRKFSLVSAGIAMILGAAAYITGFHFIQFAIGEILFACGMSLKSGSDTSIVYDSLKKLDRISDFAATEGKGQSFFLASQILGSVISGFIYEMNPEFPLLLSALLMLFSSITALFFYEVKTYEHEEKPGYFQQIIQSGKYLAGHERVRSIVIYSIFFFIFYRVGFWYYQPYMQEVGIDASYFGILFALFNLVATVSARFSGKFIALTKGKSMLAVSAFLAASFLLMGMTRMWFGFIFICLQQISRGVNVPVFMKYMNKYIPSNKRATVISFASLLKNMAAAIAFPIVGFAMDRIDPVSINLYSGILMLAGIVFFYYYLNRQMEKTKVPPS